MKILNKILLIFFIISFLTLYGGWRFIHSEKFSNEISLRVSKILTEKVGTNLSFNGVSFSLIPLSTTFQNVRISKNDPLLLGVDIEAKSLEVSFTYASFIASDLEIDEVSIRDGSIKLEIYKKSEEDLVLRDLNTREIFTKYQDFLSKLPVRLNILSLENIKMDIDQSSLYVNQASIAPHRTTIRVKTNLSAINIKNVKTPRLSLEISKLESLAILKKEDWRIESLVVENGTQKIDLQAVAFNEKNLLNINLLGNINLDIDEVVNKIPNLPDDIKQIKGRVTGKIKAIGVVDNPDGEVELKAIDFDSPWIKVRNINAVVLKKKNLLLVKNLFVKNNQEEYRLKKESSFYDLESETFTNFSMQLNIKNGYTNTFLFSAKDSLHTLKGHFSGDVEARLYDKKAVINIQERGFLKDFMLLSSDEKSEILKNPGFELEKSTITINDDYSVEIDARLIMKNTLVNAKGKITDKYIDINVSDSTIDMSALGPIAGVVIAGAGPSKVKVSGPINDVEFDFDVEWNNFSVVELNFGKAKSVFNLRLNDLELTIKSLEGVYNKSNYAAIGRLGFGDKNEGMNLKIDFPNSTFSDARKMLHVVFKNIKLPVDPEFNFNSSYSISGGFGLERLVVDGRIDGSDLIVGKEEAEKISLKFSLANNFINFKNIKIKKSRGELNANASINLKNNFMELSGATQGLRLRDFNSYQLLNLEYDGDFFLDFDGSGTTEQFSSRFKARVANAFVGNMPASSSNAILYLNTDDIVANASLLAGKIKMDTLISFKTGIAAIKSSVQTDELKEFLGIFSAHNLTDKNITGKIKANLNTQISLGSLGVRRFFLDIDQFNIQKAETTLSIEPKYNKIEVDEGIVKNWDVRFKGRDSFFHSQGKNISNGVIGVEHRFALNASLLEVLADQIEKAEGVIRGATQFVLDRKLSIKEFSLSGDDHSLKIKGLPGFITNLDYNVIKKGESYEINKMSGNYGEGEFRVGGKIFFDDLYPQLNLTYQVDRSTVPLFKKSNVLIKSNGTLTGTDLPYKLSGKVTFMHGEILDDPAELMKESKVSIDVYKKFLPDKNLANSRGFIDLNISFDTANPVVMKNNMAEVYVKGNGQLLGDVRSPELNVRVETVANVSKFKFKGHDFALNQGYLEIRDRKKNRISDLKFTGVAKVNDYDMKLDLSGSITNVNIDLSSEPALSKEDLLSLLTLGVTSDMSKNLEAGERKFVTTVGIGTLLVDQLKINEDLNSSLGLKLSVQPEFKEDESTLIQGKSAVSDGNSSRLKSATKIKVNKKINNRVDVSLSSTVGGSLEQKQEMNINLNINKNFSLEGVYEVKPTEDENTNTPNSLGADLKWRKSF